MSDNRKKPREVKTAAEEVTEQPSQRRRRLVKGALSAPVFLTLQNGSVFANTSNDASVLENGDYTVPTDAICVKPIDQPAIEGNRVDFGMVAECAEIENSSDGMGGLKVCNSTGGTGGGYIVAASSQGSITCA